MSGDDEARINAALAGRRAQRARVDQLTVVWDSLGDAFEALVTAVGDAEDAAVEAGHTADGGLAQLRQVIVDLRRTVADRHGLPGRMTEIAGRIRSLRNRIGRETVNIGVIGKTRSGKSTLLRAITGLPGSVIPSSEYDSTTAAPSRRRFGQPI